MMDNEYLVQLKVYAVIFAIVILLKIAYEIIKWFAGGWARSMGDWQFAIRFFPTVTVLTAGVVLGISALVCSEINEDIDRLLKKDVSRYTLDAITRLDARIEKQGARGKLFIKNTEALEALRQETDRFIDEEAVRLIETIDGLEKFEKPGTYVEMEMIGEKLDRIRIEPEFYLNERLSNYVFCDELESRVTNYDQFLAYEEDYREFKESVKGAEKCRRCGGDGIKMVDCSECDGVGRIKNGDEDIRCGNCDLPGQMVVVCDRCENGFIFPED